MAWNPGFPVNFTPSGDSVSESIQKHINEIKEIYAKLCRVRTLDSGSEPPIDAWKGCLWIDSTTLNKPILKVFDGSVWQVAFDVHSLEEQLQEAMDGFDEIRNEMSDLRNWVTSQLSLYATRAWVNSRLKSDLDVLRPEHFRSGSVVIGRYGSGDLKRIKFNPAFTCGCEHISVVATLAGSFPAGGSHPVTVTNVNEYGFDASCFAEILGGVSPPVVNYIAYCRPAYSHTMS